MPGGLQRGAKRPKPRPEELIDKINALPRAAFFDRFFASPSKLLRHRDYEISLKPVTELSDAEFTTCFKLIETTSAADYKNSPRGWHPKDKQREMREDNMQYLLVRKSSRTDSVHDGVHARNGDSMEPTKKGPEDEVVAFLAFMFTIEDDYPVIYIYEIHLAEEHRGSGLGRHLMHIVEHCATEGAVEKVMLTCFRCNTVALAFYQKLGFGEDEFSPPAKRLRGGKIKLPPYLIMSKSVG
ncbi:N-alpha-acetyltransferase 40 [Lasiodiplodia hormozganensis]|uniref:N-alpha-acetyltransferase 40 n=1 Tax=Lasiodiplodia hormozganensis TaxID=869390 RepID=A0AA39XYU0_9PEZI|nr:N-alpha-acetyltransferase 40 [Lasiodiplodia hormozganensis]